MTNHVQEDQHKTGMTHRRLMSAIQILHCKLKVSPCIPLPQLGKPCRNHEVTGCWHHRAMCTWLRTPFTIRRQRQYGSAGEDILDFSSLPLQAMAMPVPAVASEVHGEAAAACDHSPTGCYPCTPLTSNLPAACSVTVHGLCN